MPITFPIAMYHLTGGRGLTLAGRKRMKTNARAVMTKIVSRLARRVRRRGANFGHASARFVPYVVE